MLKVNLPLQQFEQLVCARTGWKVRPRDRHQLHNTLTARMKALRVARPQQYFDLLKSGTTSAEEEWSQVVARLTNGESYFFRDQGQMTLLRRRVLPEILERNARRRCIRIWSAGCSTGEEPYSLAIMLNELLPEPGSWRTIIIGSDINEEVLDVARRGVYNRWSFRNVGDEVRQRYFREHRDGFELDPQIRAMVSWRRLNLLRDEYPCPRAGIYDVDLILCRNVFIYFSYPAVNAVLGKFAATLREEGLLLTGHAEIHNRDLGELQPKTYPESVVYQRPPGRAAPAPRPVVLPRIPTPQPVPVPRVVVPPAPVSPSPVPRAAGPAPAVSLLEVERLVRNGHYGRALEQLEPLLRAEPQHFRALCLEAEAYASLGRHADAEECCRRAIAVDPFATDPYRLLAHIAEERGELEQARESLKKVLYLSPAWASAYLDLGTLYAREGDADRARKMRVTARDLLRAAAPEAPVEGQPDLTAGELLRHVEQLLGEERNDVQ